MSTYVFETGPNGVTREAAVTVDGFNPDQPRDEHGRWGEGGGNVAAASVAKAAGHTALAQHHFSQERLRKSAAEGVKQGGATIDPKTGSQTHKGFAVSTELEHERQIPLATYKPSDTTAYVKDKAEALSKPGAHLGLWVDGGKVYHDVTTVVDTAEKAEALGRAHKQLGFYDLEKKETVRLMKKRDGLDSFPVIEYREDMLEFKTDADGVLREDRGLALDGGDDEPRDETGKWTSGGGGSGTRPAEKLSAGETKARLGKTKKANLGTLSPEQRAAVQTYIKTPKGNDRAGVEAKNKLHGAFTANAETSLGRMEASDRERYAERAAKTAVASGWEHHESHALAKPGERLEKPKAPTAPPSERELSQRAIEAKIAEKVQARQASSYAGNTPEQATAHRERAFKAEAEQRAMELEHDRKFNTNSRTLTLGEKQRELMGHKVPVVPWR